MHIPDGFLDTKTIVATSILSAAGVATAWRQTQRHVTPQRIPLLGVTAAFVFAAQMLNFPVAGGTSGHLMGSVLCTVLVGPAAAVIVMTTVLCVQSFLFADGGFLALGANIFNIALLSPLAGYAVYRAIGRITVSARGKLAGVAVGSWLSVVVASLACAGEIAWSGTAPWHLAFPAMAGVHVLIGLGEAAISTLVVAAIQSVRPDLIFDGSETSRSGNVLYGLIIAFGLVLFVSPFASHWPDGLESVAASLGFDQRSMPNSAFTAVIPEYAMPGVRSPLLALIFAGIVGIVAVYLVTRLLGRVLKEKS
jgi:cobalt/nickel transport system permease protein